VKGIVDGGLRLDFKEFMCHRKLPTFRWECECAQSATALSHDDETSYRRKLLNFDH